MLVQFHAPKDKYLHILCIHTHSHTNTHRDNSVFVCTHANAHRDNSVFDCTAADHQIQSWGQNQQNGCATV